MSDDNNTALAAPPGPLDVLQSMGGEFMDALAHPGHEGDYDEAETSSEEEDMAVPAPLTKLAASDMSWPWSHKPTEHEKEEREKRAGKWGMGDPLQDGTEELGINWPWKKKDKEYEAEKAEAKARRARRDLEHARTKNREPLGNELQDDIYSISFTSPVQVHKQVKNPIVKLAPKPDVKTPVATSTTAQ